MHTQSAFVHKKTGTRRRYHGSVASPSNFVSVPRLAMVNQYVTGRRYSLVCLRKWTVTFTRAMCGRRIQIQQLQRPVSFTYLLSSILFVNLCVRLCTFSSVTFDLELPNLDGSFTHKQLTSTSVNPLTPTVAVWVQLWSILCQGWASESPDIENYKWRLNPGCFIAVPIWQQRAVYKVGKTIEAALNCVSIILQNFNRFAHDDIAV